MGSRRVGQQVALAGLFDRITHLPPPTGFGRIRLDRFSPFHEAPDEFDMINVRAAAPFRHLYPVDASTLDRLAYYFDFEYRDGHDPHRYVEPSLRRSRVGSAVSSSRSGLWLIDVGDPSLTVVDERLERRTVTYEGWKATRAGRAIEPGASRS